ncbi:MAG: hypothetical protein D3910_12275, partial [Candidatus Electrothrix sp. ATG2]|nr:hypothetical protein [Candidatus Electrothrix sp. ATG2]
MNAMQRVYNIGLYYPTGHDVADRAIGTFLDAVKKSVDKKTGLLHFDVTEHTLLLQRNELDPKLPVVKTFHDMFSALHITSLDIHREINADDACCFFEKLISQNTKVRNSRDFSRIIITGLPETIKIHQAKLASGEADSNGDESNETSQPTIDYLLSPLTQRGIQEEMLTICRQLLQSVQVTLEKRELNNSGLASVTWEDVEKLLFDLAEFIQSSSQEETVRPLEKRYNVDALIAILSALDDPGTDAQPKKAVRQAVNFLIDLTKSHAPDAHEDVPENVPEENNSLRPRDRTDISIGGLKKELLSLEQHHSPAPFFQHTRREQLSVLMLALGQ